MTDTITSRKLYSVRSVIDDWPHCGARYDGVTVEWVAWDRGFTEESYRELLTPYRDGDPHAQSLVDDMLTGDEVEALRRYLKTRHDVEVEVEEETLPIQTVNERGVSLIGALAVPFGGGREAYMLWEEDGYDLPIRIGGVYDVTDMWPTKVLACSHECKHHPRIDEWIDFTPPSPSAPIVVDVPF